MTTERRLQLHCATTALAAAMLVLAWQTLTVRFNYGGNWTALFLTGDEWPVPPELAPSTYVFKNSAGYDGQYYHYVAHDPLVGKCRGAYVDGPLRYLRILVPGAAALLGAGNIGRTDAAYVAVELAFVFLGSWWLSRYAAAHGRQPAWGVAFACLPATLISMDRMTVDVALAALCAGFAWYASQDAPRRLYVVAALAPLVRETGLLLIAACCLHALLRRRWLKAAVFVTAVAPAWLWCQFVAARCGGGIGGSVIPPWTFIQPVIGIFRGLFGLTEYPLGAGARRLAQGCDFIAILGILLAMGLAVWQAWRSPRRLEVIAALLFAGLTLGVSAPAYWRDVNNYARTLAPLVLLVGMRAFGGGSLWALAPWAMIDLRIGLQLGSQALGIARGLMSLLR
jgi:hypothetical protein